jgi:hypothetical protein
MSTPPHWKQPRQLNEPVGEANGPAGLEVKGQTLTDNSAVLLNLVRHGVGIARLMDLVAAPFVHKGESSKARG